MLHVVLLYCLSFQDPATTETYTYCHPLSLHDALPSFVRAPFCAMLLSDLGVDVGMVDRKDLPAPAPDAVTHRGRRHLPPDLTNAAATEACLLLAERAEILIEGFRHGVMGRPG